MSRVTKGGNGITKKYNILTHKGVDIGWRGGDNDNILAHSDGKVVWLQTGQRNNTKSKGNATYGNCIKIKHSNGYYTLYAHLDSVNVKLGQTVKKGTKIGYMGNTGNSYGKHLHFEVRNTKDVRINPTKYINSDLPGLSTSTISTKTYCVYDNVKNCWLPKVKIGSSDYAGNFKNGISGLKISGLTYRVHDKVKGIWLPWVTGDKSYAGNLPNDIDGIQIKGATYRVHDKKKAKWLPYVNGDKDYAGNIGNSIDAIQIK